MKKEFFSFTLRRLMLAILLLLSAHLHAARDSISFQHINTEHGLPQSTVNVIFQDSQGYMWFGTFDGLSRFDGYQFINFKNDPTDENSLSNNIVVSIIEDDKGFLWVGTAQNGVNRFDPKSGKFQRFVSSNDDFDSLSNAQVNVIHQDSQKRIWIGTNHGLNLFLPEKQAFAHFYNNPLDSRSLPAGAIVDIEDDGDGNLWVTSNKTLAHFNIEQQVFVLYQQDNLPNQINNLYLDSDNSLWVGSRLEGLFHLKNGSNGIGIASHDIENFNHDNNDSSSLSFNDVRAILRSSNGDLWVGTEEGGLNVRKKGEQNFIAFKRNSADPHSISINDIWAIYQDRSGLLWIGTAGGGLNTTQSFDSQFSRLTHSPYAKNSLSHEFVWDIEEDSSGNIWLATMAGLDSYDPVDDQFSHISHFSTKDNQLVGNRIQAITFGNNGDIWFGNQQGQLAVYSPQTQITKLIDRAKFSKGYVSYNRIRMVEKDRLGQIWVGTDDGLLKLDSTTYKIIADYRFAEAGQLGESTVRTMLQDSNGNIWFGTWDKGLQKYDPEFGSITSYSNEPENPNSLSNNTVRSLYFDSIGNLWIGTFNGLNLLTAKEIANNGKNFKSYLEKDGLPNSAIYGIVGDTSGNIWLSTNNGLSKFNLSLNIFENYSVQDGLPANEFNGNAVLRSKNDEIYFGSIKGVSVVSSGTSTQRKFKPNIVITSLLVMGKRINPSGVILSKNIPEFSFDSNNITFEFALLDFKNSNRNKFRYRLPPYINNWTEFSTQNQAVFTNLDPNEYNFELQANNGESSGLDYIVSLQFTVLPPIWKTWWAKLLYGVFFVVMVSYFIYRHQVSIREQQNINQHLRRVDQLKDEFLANTSHELRTPLNGIIGIAESLKEGSAGLQNKKTLNHLSLIIDGGKRLAQLVNDILDFKKLSHNSLVLQRRAIDLKAVLNVVISLLEPLSNKKSLKLINNVSSTLPLVFADEDRVQQIFHNLIGNAIKYTTQGQIIINARLNANEIEVCVTDTGIGLDSDKLEQIFKPFEQLSLPDELTQKGTGLGLSVTRQLVEEHEGKIWATAKLNHGSQFYFTLPCWLENKHSEDIVNDEVDVINFVEQNREPSLQQEVNADSNEPTKGRILIADDDPINLQVLNDLLLMNNYQVVSAKDGTEALEIGLIGNIDLAILDIMMPGLSGYDVTKNLRQKYTAIELPILLLSARNQPGDVTAGFDAGANDYVTKPIERTVLLSRIETMRLVGGLVEAKQQKQHTKTLQQACEKLGRYFPKQMVNQIITSNNDNPLIAQRKQVTVLFADLAGFTSVSDRFEPEAIADILNSFLAKMGELVESNHGILNEILGDGLVVLFGAIDNMNKQDQAQNAASLALHMQQAMTELSKEWLEAGFDHSVKLCIGLHQDFATVGNFGSKDIMAFRAVGSGVNFAARLESYAQAGEIAVSYPIYAHCRNQFNFSELQEIQFKGFNHKHRVCQLMSKQTN